MKKIVWWMGKKLNTICGVTMVELLVVIAVIGIALVPASTALVSGMKTFSIESDNMGRIYDAQNTLDYITDQVRVNGNKIISLGDQTIEGVVFYALKVDTKFIYFDSGDHTIKKYENNTTNILLENVQTLSFDNIVLIKKDNVDKLAQFDMTLVLTKREYGTENFVTTVYLRNK